MDKESNNTGNIPNKKPVLQIIIFVSILIINISSLINGIRRQENWLIIAASIGLALILFVAIVRYKRNQSVLP